MTTDLEHLQYPSGRFVAPAELNAADRVAWLQIIEQLPGLLRERVKGSSQAQWETPYRPGGWTMRQVIHHMADSHTNAFFRFKLALTEDNPTIKPYKEALWAQSADYLNEPIESSLNILTGIHSRWHRLMQSMSDADWQRTFYHPQYERTSLLHNTLALYAWHSRHHLGHVDLILA